MFLRYILCAAAAYLLGSISTGVLLSHRLFHDDVRKLRQRRHRRNQYVAHLFA